MTLQVLEICAGGGGQATGLEAAGFDLAAAVEIDAKACDTLRTNRPNWKVIQSSVTEVDGADFRGIDLLAGGVPCPPFSIAGKQLGHEDERDLFPEALRLVQEARPAAILLENVPGFASDRFCVYRRNLIRRFVGLGYEVQWRVLNACWFGVTQLRPRFVLVALKKSLADSFVWPEPNGHSPSTVGEVLMDLMSSRHWKGAEKWRRRACGIAPTLVGGSKKHGGPDLGPTRARRQWAALGIDGLGIADEPPGPERPANFTPRLTVRMAARIQGFSDSWNFSGGKTAAYRQVGNAFPPPVARAVGDAIRSAFLGMPARPRLQIPLFELAADG
ncbi:MAG TPA: DNA cytosine methyltransferase [Terriglobales bacterium]|jgi:DNA (cytosine-5)-methyltransferase 1|nr:DNA cytosine methyltransferase [Terriglobales bacterium]